MRTPLRSCRLFLLFLVAGCSSPTQLLPPPNQPAAGYESIAAQIRARIREEMESKALPAFAIGLVDRERTLWMESFGNVGREEEPRAPDVNTVYRVGSVSKLFTDIAIMRGVQRGELDIDAPVADYLGDSIQLGDPSNPPITLRHLMSHRSGLVREPPVGHYFDAGDPSLEATVQSLSGQAPIYPPGEMVKYSNAGIAVVGYVLEKTRGKPFAELLREDILTPLGMSNSAFVPDGMIQEALATAWMWTLEGRQFPAPGFELGMSPAGSLYTTIPDLCRFMKVLLNGGNSEGFQLLSRESLDRMWTPQFSQEETGYGLGFNVGKLDGERRLSHGGAIYGFATQLAILPEAGLGVVAVTNVDGANGVTNRVADFALRALLAHRSGNPLPETVTTSPLEAAQKTALEGDYRSADRRVTIRKLGQELVIDVQGTRAPLRRDRDGIVADGRLGSGLRVRPTGTGIELGGRSFERVSDPLPEPPRADWKGLIGSYGWDFNTLYVFEKEGHLIALIEWFFSYPLIEEGPDRYRFPPASLYQDEPIRFVRDANGEAIEAWVSGVRFPRRFEQPAGTTFKIEPLKPVDLLQVEALAATPPAESGKREPELVDLAALIPGLKLDIRYAGPNNFMGAPFYQQARAFMQRPAAEALARVHSALQQKGYGLLVHDAYRPWYVTRMFWDATPEGMRVFVANPANGSRHNRGCAVDLTLYDLTTGRPVEMVSVYDEFSERAYPGFPGGTSRQRWLRELLRSAMEAEGFEVYEAEWWHFDYRDWNQYPILNLTFEELEPSSPSGK